MDFRRGVLFFFAFHTLIAKENPVITFSRKAGFELELIDRNNLGLSIC